MGYSYIRAPTLFAPAWSRSGPDLARRYRPTSACSLKCRLATSSERQWKTRTANAYGLSSSMFSVQRVTRPSRRPCRHGTPNVSTVSICPTYTHTVTATEFCSISMPVDRISALTLLVGWQEGHPACKKTESWGAGVVICLERSADLHMAQLMPQATHSLLLQ